MELKFKPDKRIRDKFFTAKHFAHPAKMSSQLLIWIVENYTKRGDIILDPMAGSGTMMLACQMGRHCILIDLEQKFVDMMWENWRKMEQWGALMDYQMGRCEILQGDARNLEVLADVAIFSPPYAEAQSGGGIAQKGYQGSKHSPTDLVGKRSYMPENVGGQDNIANLPYGSIDCVLTSPPYSATGASGPTRNPFWERLANDPSSERFGREHHPSLGEGYSPNPANIGNLKHGDIDAIITSPPYEAQIHPTHETIENVVASNDPKHLGKYSQPMLVDGYGAAPGNIGNLKGDTYLEAMLQVYQQCHKALKPDGLMILVTKNFIRDKKIVPLDEHTIKLCETAGFEFVERHYRKLHAQSFWRVIAVQKCDYRSGSKDKPICKLGYTCPVDTSWQLQIALALQGVEDNVEKAIQAAERLCPYFINTVPKLEHEDVLVLRKQDVI